MIQEGICGPPYKGQKIILGVKLKKKTLKTKIQWEKSHSFLKISSNNNNNFLKYIQIVKQKKE